MEALIKQLDELKDLVQEHEALCRQYDLLQKVMAARNLYVILFEQTGDIRFQNYPNASGATRLEDFKFLLGETRIAEIQMMASENQPRLDGFEFSENKLQFQVQTIEASIWALYIEMSPAENPHADNDTREIVWDRDMEQVAKLSSCLQELRELLLTNALDEVSDVIRNNHLKTISDCLANTNEPVLRTCLEIIEQNIRDALSNQTGIDESLYSLLTPSELQIANFIRQGKSSKEIANTLKIASKTVENHRNNLRIKLGIANKGVNLRSYLINLFKQPRGRE